MDRLHVSLKTIRRERWPKPHRAEALERTEPEKSGRDRWGACAVERVQEASAIEQIDVVRIGPRQILRRDAAGKRRRLRVERIVKQARPTARRDDSTLPTTESTLPPAALSASISAAPALSRKPS
jgi:hypothetical protein